MISFSNQQPLLSLAPMEGITNAIFRELIIKLGAVEMVATEFIRITGTKQKVPDFQRSTVPLQIQFMGNSAETISECLKFLKDSGKILEDDYLDLNVGCPSKKVNSKGSGAALLLRPVHLVKIIDSIRAVHTGPLSIKTRLGFQDSEKFAEILAALKDCPLDFISIHARSCQGKYTEKVDYSFFEQATKTLPYPLIGNGDITGTISAEKVLATGAAGLMIGRGAITNPYIFNQIKAKLKGEEFLVTKDMLVDFAEKLLLSYLAKEQTSKKKLIGHYKEFAIWFSKNPLIGRDFFQNLKREQSLASIQANFKQIIQ